MRAHEVYGVTLTSIQSMKFSKHLQNNPDLPAPNTISKEERKQLVLNWLESEPEEKAIKYSIHKDVFTGKFHTLLLGGEFANCHGQGSTKDQAIATLKIRVYQLRRNRENAIQI